MKKLTKGQILLLHHEMIETHGGSSGIRDDGLLESALAAPFQAFGGKPLLLTVQQKAVRLGYGLIINHPFVDGNKRIGAHVMLTVLAMNGIELEYTQREFYELIIKIAASEASYEELLKWVIDHETEIRK
ncbi:MAG: type II toxin-antitoxin system death-on-curing family toxin [Oscillospiraceae bacterium]|nr:type II toxin-antitoxin system death-on-curing family toxin [Oscillospiraceae bacterium]